MGFNPTFYAGRPKLSEVTIDSDLDMGGRNITGVDTLQAGRVDSPYMPKTWPTVTIPWNDYEPVELQRNTNVTIAAEGQKWTNTGDTAVHVKFSYSGGTNNGFTPAVKINGVLVGTSLAVPYWVNPGEEMYVYSTYGNIQRTTAVFTDVGHVGPGVTIDLTGKWLAVGLDMHGLAATVKIQGVDIPYSDYAKYFPLAPTEITFPAGGWDASQIRPIVEVYV